MCERRPHTDRDPRRAIDAPPARYMVWFLCTPVPAAKPRHCWAGW
ncbi:MAG: hypothetical protein ACTH5D_01710 [Halomonas sp.]